MVTFLSSIALLIIAAVFPDTASLQIVGKDIVRFLVARAIDEE
jgi:hypothetical protein